MFIAISKSKLVLALLVVIGVMGVCHDAFAFSDAVTMPSPDTDVGEFIKAMFSALTDGDYKIFAGFVLVGAVYVVRRFVLGNIEWAQTKLGGVTLAVAMSVAASFGMALGAGEAITLALAFSAISTAAAAAGVWQWVQSLLENKATA